MHGFVAERAKDQEVKRSLQKIEPGLIAMTNGKLELDDSFVALEHLIGSCA